MNGIFANDRKTLESSQLNANQMNVFDKFSRWYPPMTLVSRALWIENGKRVKSASNKSWWFERWTALAKTRSANEKLENNCCFSYLFIFFAETTIRNTQQLRRQRRVFFLPPFIHSHLSVLTKAILIVRSRHCVHSSACLTAVFFTLTSS